MENKLKAIALKYPEGAYAPFITAKGEGKLAEKIIEEAKKNDIYIEENVEAIDFLDACDIGTEVPEEAWEVVAQIFSFILQNQ